jgi:nitrate/nitrite transport system ATP-binding protein
VSRSKAFADDIKSGGYDRRRVPVVRPGAPDPVIASDASAGAATSWPGMTAESQVQRGRHR